MKIKNTAPGGRGFSAGGKNYEIEAGATAEIPDAAVAEARKQADGIAEGWFADGTFVVDSGKAAAPAARVTKVEVAKPEDEKK
jgi:hypothetical protein